MNGTRSGITTRRQLRPCPRSRRPPTRGTDPASTPPPCSQGWASSAVNTPRSSPAPLSPSSPRGRLSRLPRRTQFAPPRTTPAVREASLVDPARPDDARLEGKDDELGPVRAAERDHRSAHPRWQQPGGWLSFEAGPDVLPGQLRARRRTHRTRPREAKRRSLVREREPSHAQVLIVRGQPRRHAGVVNGLHQRSLHRPGGDQCRRPTRVDTTIVGNGRQLRGLLPASIASPDPASSGEGREIDRATPRPWPLPPVVPERMASPDDAT
jgi:hypothetical protein